MKTHVDMLRASVVLMILILLLIRLRIGCLIRLPTFRTFRGCRERYWTDNGPTSTGKRTKLGYHHTSSCLMKRTVHVTNGRSPIFCTSCSINPTHAARNYLVTPNQPMPETKSQTGKEDEQIDQNIVRCNL
jgi:hypothetical protein